ncbi:hypothetical protein I4U23_030246 [Adineta vaga]|nr:hypothetical protein I4U23_030246 [Adineta vaga]
MERNNFALSDDIMDINECISVNSSLISMRSASPDVFPSQTLTDAVRCILDNNTKNRNNQILTEYQVEIFEIIEQLHSSPKKLCHYLTKDFAKYFDIDLYLITFDNNEFCLNMENNYGKEHKAFLLLNKDYTVRGPLYTINTDGTKQSVFCNDDSLIQVEIYCYILQLNDTDLFSNSSLPEESDTTSYVSQVFTNQVDNVSITSVDYNADSRELFRNMSYQIFRLYENLNINHDLVYQAFSSFLSKITQFEHLSAQDTILALNDGINCLSNLVKMVQPHIPIENEQLSSNQVSAPDDTMVSHIETEHNNSVQSFISNTVLSSDFYGYEPPTMNKLLQTPYHPRTMKEFAKTGSSPIQCVDAKQREPLHIGVPPDDGVSLYLGVTMVTDAHTTHCSKVVVPDNAKIEGDYLMNNNDLTCLKYDKCDPDDKFYLDEKVLYSKIRPKEREMKQKDISIHMLNLYQRGSLNRKTVQDQQLKKSKLALWFAVYENNMYRHVSRKFYSNTIEERKCH